MGFKNVESGGIFSSEGLSHEDLDYRLNLVEDDLGQVGAVNDRKRSSSGSRVAG